MITTVSEQVTLSGRPAGQALLSDDGVYRYALWRTWGDNGERVAWVMLNPSTAAEMADDPTIRRVMAFSKLWGFGGLTVVNLFALRATDPRELKSHPLPLGPRNDAAIYSQCALDPGRLVVAAWGAGGTLHDRAEVVTKLLHGTRLRCLGTNKGGSPRHPLYCRASSPLVPYPLEAGNG